MASKKAETAITIPAIEIGILSIQITGSSPLIVHKWSEKAKREMLAKQQKRAKAGREIRDPEAEYRESLYVDEDGDYCFPAIAFKKAMVAACRFLADLPMTVARGAFFVEGEMVKISGEPRMREDMVRVGMGSADLRYRGEFPEWSAELLLSYNAAVLSPEQIINLLNTAGYATGIGENRPERSGPYGRFKVAAQ